MGAHRLARQRANSGATAVPRLTDLTLKNLPLPERGHVTHWDKPLGVRVSPTGAKTFIVILQSGRRHRIGRYGDITLAQARQAATTLKAEKTLGRILPKNISFAQARSEYLAAITVRAATREYYERFLNRLHASKLQDITPRELNRILDKLRLPSRIQAIRSYSAFFNWCMRRHYLDTSPCARMIAGTSPSRSRVLSDDELACVWITAGEGGMFGIIVKLLILTGQRRGEIAALQTKFFNDNACTLPPSLTKNGREHTFPLGSFTARIVSTAILTASYSGLLFPARGNATASFNGWSKSKAALDKASGVTEWTLHDLRRTYRTIHARIGTPPHIAERLINHVSSTSEVERIYDRFTYMPDMKTAVQSFETHIKAVLGIE